MKTISGVTGLNGIMYADNKFVFVAVGGGIYSSADGTTWTRVRSTWLTTINGITYGNNTFVAVGNGGTILTSSDGTTWTSRTSGTTQNLRAVCAAQ